MRKIVSVYTHFLNKFPDRATTIIRLNSQRVEKFDNEYMHVVRRAQAVSI